MDRTNDAILLDAQELSQAGEGSFRRVDLLKRAVTGEGFMREMSEPPVATRLKTLCDLGYIRKRSDRRYELTEAGHREVAAHRARVLALTPNIEHNVEAEAVA